MDILSSFDAAKFKLGTLCDRTHQWQDTQYSLRYVSNNCCVECQRERRERTKEETKKYKARYFQENKERLKQKSDLYYQENKEKIAIRNRNYRLNNQEKVKKRKKDYYQQNAEQIRAKSALWYQENKERAFARARDYYAKNNEKIRLQRAVYREKNREYFKAYHRTYYLTYKEQNQDRIKAYRIKWNHSPEGREYKRIAVHRCNSRKKQNHACQYTPEQVKKRMADFDNCCAYCGKTANTNDHFVAISSGGADVIGNIIPACGTCNSSKCNRDAKEWYFAQPFFNKKRWQKILRVLRLNESTLGQVPLF